MVEDRRIRCHKVGGHGTENFVQGIQNSCNPVFIELGLRIGVDRFCDYFHKFGLMNLTGVDIPGEAGTGSIFRARRRRSCIKRKISDR